MLRDRGNSESAPCRFGTIIVGLFRAARPFAARFRCEVLPRDDYEWTAFLVRSLVRSAASPPLFLHPATASTSPAPCRTQPCASSPSRPASQAPLSPTPSRPLVWILAALGHMKRRVCRMTCRRRNGGKLEIVAEPKRTMSRCEKVDAYRRMPVIALGWATPQVDTSVDLCYERQALPEAVTLD